MKWFNGVTYSFAPATVISSGEMNANFEDLEDAINEAMPTGTICLWSGAIIDIEPGWTLCNGSNGTPNVRDLFIVGAGSSYAVGDTGGTTAIDISHTHSIYHEHYVSRVNDGSYWSNAGSGLASGGDYAGLTMSGSQTQVSSGAMSANSWKDIRPPFYALAYIMKTS